MALSAEIKAQIKALWANNHTVAAIARIVNCNPSSVKYIIDPTYRKDIARRARRIRAGLSSSGSIPKSMLRFRFTMSERAYMQFLSSRGYNCGQIARHLNINKSRVLYWTNPEYRRDEIRRSALNRSKRTLAERHLDTIDRRYRRGGSRHKGD